MVSSGRALLVAASLAAFILFVSAAACAATSPGVEWEKTYDVGGNDHGWSMQQTSDGGFVMAGTSGNLVCLAKVDADGNIQWKNTYGFGDSAKGYSVRQTTDGGYIVTGSARQSGKDKVLLMKMDKNGTQLWNKTYGDASPGSVEGAGTSVRQASDGGYVIAAQYPYQTTSNSGIYLLKTDASGNIQRSVMVGKNGDVTSPSVEQTSDGGYIIAATIHTSGYQSSQPDYDIYLIKFDPSGSTKWERTIGGAGSQYCGRDGSVKQTRDGGYIIAGENGGAYLAKTDSSGNLLWGKKYNDSVRANSVIPADDGGYLLAGTDTAGKLLIIKTSSTGDEQWRDTADVAGEAATIQKTSDGGYAASGTSGGDLYLVKLKAPAGTSSSLFLNKGDLFAGSDLFKIGSTGGSAMDMGQTTATGNSLFGPSTLKMFNLNGDTGQSSTRVNSPSKFSSMPSFGFKNTGARLSSADFPKITPSFGNSGWPFS
jgi:hypothetical protein